MPFEYYFLLIYFIVRYSPNSFSPVLPQAVANGVKAVKAKVKIFSLMGQRYDVFVRYTII